jgi:hypothetical protein
MALKSSSIVRLVDVLCEGPIKELKGWKQGVYLNETPVEQVDEDGVTINNFSEVVDAPDGESSAVDIDLHFRPGGKTQETIGGFVGGTHALDSTNIISVGQEIGANYSETLDNNDSVISRSYGGGEIVRSLTDKQLDQVQFIFTIPALYSRAKEGLAKGQLFNATIRIFIYTRAKGGSWKERFNRNIKGISTSEYQIQTPWISLWNAGEGPFDVKVVKKVNGEDDFEVTYFDFEDENLKKEPLAADRANRIFLTSITERVVQHINYRYTAHVGIGFPSKTFPNIPNRAYLVKGLLVPTPHNAVVRDDGSLDFPTNASFNGELIDRWTTCPVSVFYALCTNKVWGAGHFIEASNLNWVDLYPLCQYANQLVSTPDGDEPRFAINTVIGNKTSAHNLIKNLASVFRGMAYWSSNTIQLTADHGNLDGTDISPVHLYSNSSVIGGLFNYSGTSLKTRSTCIKVTYNDPDNFYKPNFTLIEDQALINKYGYQLKEITAFGCASKWQAQRLGRWMMTAEEIDQEVVTFSVGLEGVAVFPGQVFAIADQVRQGSRLSGRVVSATTTAITLDQVAPTSGDLTCVMPDGDVETKTVSSGSGNVATTEAFSAAPQADSVWSYTTTNVVNQKFRCLSVDEQGDGTYTITASEFNDSVYQTADNNTPIEEENVSLFNGYPAPPTNLSWAFSQVRINNNTVNRITWSWDRGLSGQSASFFVAIKGGANPNEWVYKETDASSYDIDNLKPGTTLRFAVASKWPLNNRRSRYTQQSITVPAATATGGSITTALFAVPLPPNAENVNISPTANDEANLIWGVPKSWGGNVSDLTAIIRHSSKTDGTGTWQDSTLLREVEANTNFAVLPLMNGEYLIKFKDKNGGKSSTAVSAVINILDAIPRLTQSTRREDQDSPPFQGQRDNVFYSDEYDALVLDGTDFIDERSEDMDTWGSMDFLGELQTSGTYYFNNYVDLGGKFSVVLKRLLTTRGLYPNNTIDDKTAFIDTWSDFDGDLADETNAELYFRISDGAPAVGDFDTEDEDFLLLEDGDKIEQELNTTFGDWVKMETGRYTGRVFQFKCELSSASVDQTPIIDEVGYTLLFDSRTESGSSQSGTGAQVVTYSKAFYQTPKLAITANDMQSGDRYAISSETRSSFTINFYNSSGSGVDRNFQYQANGYGAQE